MLCMQTGESLFADISWLFPAQAPDSNHGSQHQSPMAPGARGDSGAPV